MNFTASQSSRRFKPCRIKLSEQRNPSPNTIHRAVEAGIDLNSTYQIYITESHIRGQVCPFHLNSSVHISGIDPTTTLAQIFAGIQGRKIWSFSKRPPLEGSYPACAADIIFMTRSGAESLVCQANSTSVYVAGKRARVI